MKGEQRVLMRSWHAFVVGSVLGVAALVERVPLFVSGRTYVLCHVPSAVDHLTIAALALVGGAFVAAVTGGVAAIMRESPRPEPVLLVVCMVAALAFVVAADRVDAAGEQRVARLAVGGTRGASCGFYSATPGWFSW
ncbi:hypothetical protein [Streptomyces aureus]|uniref:hypothetical protein n=1 Tax=Streptomyces aureus TaxID=193461 RepID=UPI0033EAF2DE